MGFFVRFTYEPAEPEENLPATWCAKVIYCDEPAVELELEVELHVPEPELKFDQLVLLLKQSSYLPTILYEHLDRCKGSPYCSKIRNGWEGSS